MAAGMRAAALTPDPAAVRDPPPPPPRRLSFARRRATAVAVVSSLRVEPSRNGPCCSNGGVGGSPAAVAEGGAQAGTLGEAVAWELEEAGDAGGDGGGGPAGGAARWGMRAVGSTAARAGSVMRGAQRMGVLGARVRPLGFYAETLIDDSWLGENLARKCGPNQYVLKAVQQFYVQEAVSITLVATTSLLHDAVSMAYQHEHGISACISTSVAAPQELSHRHRLHSSLLTRSEAFTCSPPNP